LEAVARRTRIRRKIVASTGPTVRQWIPRPIPAAKQVVFYFPDPPIGAGASLLCFFAHIIQAIERTAAKFISHFPPRTRRAQKARDQAQADTDHKVKDAAGLVTSFHGSIIPLRSLIIASFWIPSASKR